MLLSGEVDALILDTVSSMRFENYPEITHDILDPLSFYSTSLATSDRELAPLMHVLQKYLDSEPSMYVSQLYNEGEQAYAQYMFKKSLTDDERAYLDAHAGTPVSVSLLHDAYSASFYNPHTGEVDGMAPSVLQAIAAVTGLDFEIERYKQDAEVYLNLLYSDVTSGNYLPASEPFARYPYVFLSLLEIPNVEYTQIRHGNVGYRVDSEYAINYERWFGHYENSFAYETSADAFAALRSGEIDFLLACDMALYYSSTFLEESDLKANYYFDTYYEDILYFAPNEEILCSIIDKAQATINLPMLESRVRNHTYFYEKDSLEQLNRVIGVSLMVLATIACVLWFISNSNKRLAEIYPLTQLPNRRLFYRKANDCIRVGAGRELSICFADIDKFKILNDTYGHEFGDVVLAECAKALVQASRANEKPFRYGGEEFVSFLANTPLDGALAVTQRALENVRAIRFDEHPELRLTISIGICTRVLLPETSIDEMVADADAAMYAAKHAGGDCAVVYNKDLSNE